MASTAKKIRTASTTSITLAVCPLESEGGEIGDCDCTTEQDKETQEAPNVHCDTEFVVWWVLKRIQSRE
jgi:hypothetical protein